MINFKKTLKRLGVVAIATVALSTAVVPAFAANTDQYIMTREELDHATMADMPVDGSKGNPVMPLSRNTKPLTIPGGKGTLTAKAWHSSPATKSGNTYQWDYQVSATYSGSYKVASIRTTWKGSASLRKSASINLGITDTDVSAGGSSSWQKITTVSKYWENTNGAKESSYRSNMVVAPCRDYRIGTIALVNTARVKLSKDAKPYEIKASC